MREKLIDLFKIKISDAVSRSGINTSNIPTSFKLGWVRQGAGWTLKNMPVLNRYSFYPLFEKFFEYPVLENDLKDSFFSVFPEYKDKKIITDGSSSSFDFREFLRFIFWQCYESIFRGQDVSRCIEKILRDAFDHLEKKKYMLECVAPLLNFRPTFKVPEIKLNESMSIKLLKEDELLGLINSGYSGVSSFSQSGIGRFEYAIFIEKETRIRLVPLEENVELIGEDFSSELNLVISAFRILKSGHVGFDKWILGPKEPIPIGFVGSQSWMGQVIVPHGQFLFGPEDAEDLIKIFKILSEVPHRTFSVAISRLCEAETRAKPYDKLLDAVIGLEAILLSSLDETSRGELAYRFSLNYSSLFKEEEKHLEFKKARNIYKLRSQIVHGGAIDKMDEFFDAAKVATDMLRFLIKHFITNHRKPDYLQGEYWEKRIFDL